MNFAEHFAWPEGWPLLLLAPVVGLGLFTFARLRDRRLADTLGRRSAALTGGMSRTRRRVRILLFTAAVLFAVLAALQPMWGESSGDLDPGGLDIVVCLDVSRSMLARDIAPSRLLKARSEIRSLAERAGGDRLALVVFAGDARLLVPLTRDVDSFCRLLEQADPLSVPSGGTDLGAALETAREALSGVNAGTGRVVLLLTDGDDLAGKGLSAARACGERGVPVHCIGFGTALGAKVPVDTGAGEEFLRDRTGREVILSLDAERLKAVAEASGGEYRSAGALHELYDGGLRPAAMRSSAAGGRSSRENRFQWPLLLSLLLWILDLCLIERRR